MNSWKTVTASVSDFYSITPLYSITDDDGVDR